MNAISTEDARAIKFLRTEGDFRILAEDYEYKFGGRIVVELEQNACYKLEEYLEAVTKAVKSVEPWTPGEANDS